MFLPPSTVAVRVDPVKKAKSDYRRGARAWKTDLSQTAVERADGRGESSDWYRGFFDADSAVGWL